MYKRIHFKGDALTTFLGRNGYFKCSGFTLLTEKVLLGNPDSFVSIWPITSLGTDARAKIEVPLSALDELISALQEAKLELQDKEVG